MPYLRVATGIGVSDIARHRLILLDGVRGIAAMGVMLFHAEAIFGRPGAFARCYLFVDLFFLLSGFVLTLSAEPRMTDGSGASAFLRARIVRLWPVTAWGVAAGALSTIAIGQGQDIAGLVLLGLAMIPAIFASGQIFPLNGPQWSIFLELVANLAHALVLRRLGNRGLSGIVALSGVLLIPATFHVGSDSVGAFAMDWWLALPRLFFSYTLGVLLARTWPARQRTPLLSWEVALILPLLSLVALNALPLAIWAGDVLAVMALFPLLFRCAAVATVPLRAEAWLRRLGAMSFPLYAVHVPVLMVFTLWGKSAIVMLLAVLAALGCAGLLAALPSLSTRRRERRTSARRADAVEPIRGLS